MEHELYTKVTYIIQLRLFRPRDWSTGKPYAYDNENVHTRRPSRPRQKGSTNHNNPNERVRITAATSRYLFSQPAQPIPNQISIFMSAVTKPKTEYPWSRFVLTFAGLGLDIAVSF